MEDECETPVSSAPFDENNETNDMLFMLVNAVAVCRGDVVEYSGGLLSKVVPKVNRHYIQQHRRTDRHCIHLAVIHEGDLRPLGIGSEKGPALHLAQQSKQSVREPQEGIQGHLLARGTDPVLPVCRSPKGLHHCPEMIP
nr:hypothetical protein Itr_chr07CG08020 [Ipomoea trifida]